MTKFDLKDMPSETTLVTFYQELCKSYHAIDDFRGKLLALLPVATGAGVLAFLGNLTLEKEKYLGPLGLFGFVITFGLFTYEIFGIRKCHELIKAGKRIETLCLNIEDGQFKTRPRSVLNLVDEPFAAGVIYPAVLASWAYLALVFAQPKASLPAAALVFCGGFVGMLIYDIRLRRDGEHFQDQLQEEAKRTQT